MDEKFCGLINGYIDETLDADQLEELQRWICNDPDNADQFARYLYLHHQIHCEQNASSLPLSITSETPHIVLKKNEVAAVFSLFDSRRAYLSAFAVMLMVTVFCAAFYLNSPGKSQALSTAGKSETSDKPFVHVAQLVDAVFVSGSSLEEDVALGPSTVSLKSGLARLQFDDGVEVTLQGPAEYAVIGRGTTRLRTGVLTATVPVGAEGFTVKTPSGDVIDLGTAFGIELDSTGNSKVSVFEGEVEILSTELNQKRRVTEGKAVKLSAGKIEPIDFQSDYFDKVWPVSSGIKGSTGDFRFAPAWRPLKMIQSNSTIFVVPEKRGVTLRDALTVDIADSSSVKKTSELSIADLDAGKRVKSFLLQFNPETAGPPKRPSLLPGRGNAGRPERRGPPGNAQRKPAPKSIKRISGNITFDRPILGLIVTERKLVGSDSLFQIRRKTIPLKRRGLELRDNMIGDVVTLSADRRTVSLSLNAIQQLADQVRVIVDDSLPDFSMPNVDR